MPTALEGGEEKDGEGRDDEPASEFFAPWLRQCAAPPSLPHASPGRGETNDGSPRWLMAARRSIRNVRNNQPAPDQFTTRASRGTARRGTTSSSGDGNGGGDDGDAASAGWRDRELGVTGSESFAIVDDDGRAINDLESFASLGNGQVRPSHIEEMELRLMRRLDWRLFPPTPAAFIEDLFPLVASGSRGAAMADGYEFSRFLAELSVCAYPFVSARPSSVAVIAALILD